MSLPALANWTDTRLGLQQAAQVIGAVRASLAQPEPNWVHLGLRVVPAGVTTGVLPAFGELILDFNTQAIRYKAPGHGPIGFALARHTQVSLVDTVENGLAAIGQPVTIPREKLTGTQPFKLDPGITVDYAQALSTIAAALGRFRESLPGEKTTPIVWPHGFDLAFLWFITATATEEAPHMAFGFSPYSAGLERPYLYTYAHPLPDDITKLELPRFTRWHTTGWTGTITEYDDLVHEDDPATVINDILRAIHAAVLPLMDV